MRHAKEKETRLLVFSLSMALVSSALGIVTGLLSHSQLILFDGLYSLISLGLSLTSFWTARFMARNDWKRYPFGKAAAEPLAMVFNYTVLLVVAIQFILEAIGKLLAGGQEVDTGIAIAYGASVTFLCGITALILKLFSRGQNSGLLKVESDGWLFDTFVSLAVLIAFVLVRLSEASPILATLEPYADPVFVIAISLMFIRISVAEIVGAAQEILDVSPQTELTQKLHDLVAEIEEEYRIKDSYVRVSQGRRLIWLEIDFVVDENSRIKTVKDEDEVRERIYKALRGIRKVDKWVTIAFTTNPRWAR